MTYTKSIELAGKQLTIETGKLAQQADGAVTVRYGDTVILATAVASKTAREGIDFFPLTVEYEERHYAVGRIPGSFFRREGRPTTEAILTARLVDRPIRPLFPKGFRNEVQIIVTTLSTDQENDPDVLAILGASAALSISDIPFGGPVAGVRIGRINGRYVVNPTFSERDDSDLDLVVAGTADAIMMVEAGASQVEEAVMLEGLRVATEAIREMVELQEDLVAEVGRPKREIEVRLPDPAIEEAVRAYVADDLLRAVSTVGKQERNDEIAALRNRTLEHFLEQYSPIDVSSAFEEQLQRAIRGRILELGARPDGRRPDEIRPISCEVGLLPRTHGSGLFSRGETQVLTMATLGSKGDAQRLDTLEPISSKRFMHHYNFPPFSTGETGRVGSPRRREIGHGALGERALEPVIPPEEDFPYTIRLVSEVLSSNGSTSMASVCGSTLALMDAGVPISQPVAGVAMGLVLGDGGQYRVLTDIVGMEDHYGDMDFKVAGTQNGITALQMDIKVKGITLEIMRVALEQAREGRLFILERLMETISAPRDNLSPYAPRIYQIQIEPDKIGAVIGPGGRVIRAMVEETKCQIDIEDDGMVVIAATNEAQARRAIQMIEALTKEVEIGQIYTGKVTRLMSFGAFVEILPGKEGLVHISELDTERVNRVEDVVQAGDEVTVMVSEIDSMGRINLSRRAVLQNEEPEDVLARAPARGGGGAGPRGPRGPDTGAGRFQRPGERRGPSFNGGASRSTPAPHAGGDEASRRRRRRE